MQCKDSEMQAQKAVDALMSQVRIFISEWSTNPIVLAKCLFMHRYSSKFSLPDNAYAC